MKNIQIIVATIATILISSNLAFADCRTKTTPILVSSNESANATSTMNDVSCTHQYNSSKTLLTESSIVKKPNNGKLEIVNASSVKYTPNKNFKGIDNYSIKFCGTYMGDKGCATYNYTMTVQ